jgi:hypothetical protein
VHRERPPDSPLQCQPPSWPTPTLDTTAHPQLLDVLLAFTLYSCLLALHATSRALLVILRHVLLFPDRRIGPRLSSTERLPHDPRTCRWSLWVDDAVV